MGPKAPDPGGSFGDAAPEDNPFDHRARPPESATGRLLQRIAEALAIPAATLYGPRAAERDDGSAERRADEAEALLSAFRRIEDPELRNRLLDLVRNLAERPASAHP